MLLECSQGPLCHTYPISFGQGPLCHTLPYLLWSLFLHTQLHPPTGGCPLRHPQPDLFSGFPSYVPILTSHCTLRRALSQCGQKPSPALLQLCWPVFLILAGSLFSQIQSWRLQPGCLLSTPLLGEQRRVLLIFAS